MGLVEAERVGGTILAVEDSPEDRELIRRALQSDGSVADLRFVSDGGEALEYLLRRGRYHDPASSPRPDLILLDLKLPGTTGFEVLELVKADRSLRPIPIVVVTSSELKRDMTDAYTLGCNSYVVKPLEAHGFMGAVREIYSYWFGVCGLPVE